MEPSSPPILYVREECHLCRLAEQLLEDLGFDWQAVDIDQEEGLEQRYGLRVPVIRDPLSEKEIDYPFSQQDIRNLLIRA